MWGVCPHLGLVLRGCGGLPHIEKDDTQVGGSLVMTSSYSDVYIYRRITYRPLNYSSSQKIIFGEKKNYFVFEMASIPAVRSKGVKA